MKILVSPDSFKGSLTARAAATALARGLRTALPEAIILEHPLSDGGEGTLDVLTGVGFELHTVSVVDSFGSPLTARCARNDTHVVIESAQAFGFHPHATPEQALDASSYGVGLMIRAALDLSPTTITLTVGGTSGTDGGAGMLQALGARILDATGTPVGRGGGALSAVETCDLSGLDPRLLGVEVQVVTDVINPLLGERGSARVFGPQKGATPEAIVTLEAGLVRFAKLLNPALATQPGTGAGGGLSYAAVAALSASLRSGAQWMMDLTHWEDALDDVDLVITGEGSFDQQSLEGKITGAVIQRAQQRAQQRDQHQGVPVVVVCGVNKAAAPLAGVQVVQLLDWAATQEEAITRAEPLMEQAGRFIAAGV